MVDYRCLQYFSNYHSIDLNLILDKQTFRNLCIAYKHIFTVYVSDEYISSCDNNAVNCATPIKSYVINSWSMPPLKSQAVYLRKESGEEDIMSE